MSLNCVTSASLLIKKEHATSELFIVTMVHTHWGEWVGGGYIRGVWGAMAWVSRGMVGVGSR